jgi:hypothetical protein
MNDWLASIFDNPIQTLPSSLFPNAKLNTKKLDLVLTNAVAPRLGVRVLLTLARENLRLDFEGNQGYHVSF